MRRPTHPLDASVGLSDHLGQVGPVGLASSTACSIWPGRVSDSFGAGPVGPRLASASVPSACQRACQTLTGLRGDANLAGDLGLADAEGEQLRSVQRASLEPFTFLVCRGAGKGWHGLILPVGWSSSNSSPHYNAHGHPWAGGHFPPKPGPGPVLCCPGTGQHRDKGSAG